MYVWGKCARNSHTHFAVETWDKRYRRCKECGMVLDEKYIQANAIVHIKEEMRKSGRF